MKERINGSIIETAESCYEYMLSDEGKDMILNPIGKEPILNVIWKPVEYCEEIKSRLYMYVENFLKSEEVTEKFKKIKNELFAFYKRKEKEISGMEKDWLDEQNDDDATSENINLDVDIELSTGDVVAMIATSPIWIPLLAVGLVLAVGTVGISLALTPFFVQITLVLNRNKRKKELVEEEYKTFRDDVVRSLVRNQLKENTGVFLEKITDKVTLELKRRLEALDESTKQLLESRDKINANVHILQNQARKIKTMKETCHMLLKKLNSGDQIVHIVDQKN